MAENTKTFNTNPFKESEIKINGYLADIMYKDELAQRKIFMNMDICMENIDDAIRLILMYNRLDKDVAIENRKPIIIYISSNGGDVDAGLELIDTILQSKTPVYTVNLGYQYSMGFLIGLAGHKRFASQHAKFLVHDGSSLAYGSSSKVRDEVEFRRRKVERIKAYVVAHSKITAEEYENNMRIEWYLFADEAKEKGFTDYILGVDCDLEDIL